MSESPQLQSSRVRVYWIVWLGIVLVTFLLRFTVFASSAWVGNLSVVYALGTWLPILLMNIMESARLMAYVKAHHRAKWEELTWTPWSGPGGSNGFRTLPWLYSSDDLNDSVLAAMKEDYRRFSRLMMAVFFSYLVILPALS